MTPAACLAIHVGHLRYRTGTLTTTTTSVRGFFTLLRSESLFFGSERVGTVALLPGRAALVLWDARHHRCDVLTSAGPRRKPTGFTRDLAAHRVSHKLSLTAQICNVACKRAGDLSLAWPRLLLVATAPAVGRRWHYGASVSDAWRAGPARLLVSVDVPDQPFPRSAPGSAS